LHGVEHDGIDMKSQLPVNAVLGQKWFRCRRVEFVGETVNWELSRTGEYDFLSAYAQAPHVQLIRATDDDSLRAFVRSWGPFRLFLEAWTGSDSLARYRRERDLLRSWALLFEAIQKNDGTRAAVLDVLRLDPKSHAIVIRGMLRIPGESHRSLDEDAFGRIAHASEKEFAGVCEHVVGSFPSPNRTIAIDRTGRQPKLVAKPLVVGLMNALHWMLEEDIAAQRAIKRCAERNCGRFIVFSSEHSREFCSYECAHRRAARKSAKKMRDKAPKKRDAERKKNGAQKTR
jgi:hypothetical protein